MGRRLDTEEFLSRARAQHGNRYDYVDTVFSHSSTKVEIRCRTHGAFLQKPHAHIAGRGCPQCSGNARLSSDQFRAKARAVHGDRYVYTGSRYRTSGTPVVIRCPRHGDFEQTPNNHLGGQGCPGCAGNGISGTREFIQKARARHGDRYGYDRVAYRTSKTPVELVCPLHGIFEQMPNNHLQGAGCLRCGRQEAGQGRVLSQADFVDRAQTVHNARYGYDRTEYVRSDRKITITCAVHGDFRQTPNSHLAGQGCRSCAGLERLGTDVFVDRAIEVHGPVYGYDAVSYKNKSTPVPISCPRHGTFEQRPHDHVNKGAGCPACANHYSAQQREVEAYIHSLGEQFRVNDRSIIAPLELDLLLPERRVAVEFNGVFHHSVTERTWNKRNLHRSKYLRCRDMGIALYQIGSRDWENPIRNQIWKSVLASKLGHTNRLFARSTTFHVISRSEASEFLELHHLQGSTTTIRWSFALRHKGSMVAVMTFSRYQDGALNLTRMAFSRYLTVVGGASKLFQNALAYLPNLPIVTFSDNRYSSGDVYPRLGFSLHGSVKPSYQWLFRRQLLNKRHCRHARLSTLLGDAYDSSLTEHQNMFRAGARCLYDAGYQRWRFSAPLP